MKKLLQLLSIVLLTVTPAIAHMSEKFHAHPHGNKLDPTDTTILLILIGIVMAMIVGFLILIFEKTRKR